MESERDRPQRSTVHAAPYEGWMARVDTSVQLETQSMRTRSKWHDGKCRTLLHSEIDE